MKTLLAVLCGLGLLGLMSCGVEGTDDQVTGQVEQAVLTPCRQISPPPCPGCAAPKQCMQLTKNTCGCLVWPPQ
jgi:hypothetical protein